MDKTGRAPGSIPEPELQEFHTGAAAHAYRTFGCHALSGAAGHRFAVWAPHAQRVALVGDFNGWDTAATPMDRLPDGTWVQTVDGLRDGALYKYAVTGPDGQTVLKADPFAAHCETGPATASKVWAIEGYVWHDRSYLRRRAARDVYRAPMSIYEVHLGSWRRSETGLPWYRSIADELADYCREMHYTHVELRAGRHTSSNTYRDTKLESDCPYPYMEKALNVVSSGRQPQTAAALAKAQRMREEAEAAARAEAEAAEAAAKAEEEQQNAEPEIELVDVLPGTKEGYGFGTQTEEPETESTPAATAVPEATLPPSKQ